MGSELEQKKKELQSLLVRVPSTGSFESVPLTEQIYELAVDIRDQELRERGLSFQLLPQLH